MILECNRGDLPRFVALNLDKLPPISIDCIDVSALLRKQQLMEMDMSQLKSTVDEVLKWVPGHAGLPGNELADEIAREAANLEQRDVPVDLPSAKARLRRHAHRKWEQRLQPTRYALQNGVRRSAPAEHLGLSRRECVEAARLRTDHSMMLREYRHRIGLEDDPTCPECGLEDETLAHLLTDCPARAEVRRRIFGEDEPEMREALGDPTKLVELLKRLGRL
ncbi:hypothetical protein FJT64_018702 [Amphibalanus amphitrite]|uniref:RNase H type-1 domain-containing protein n=1 Tax=Amphibalanus amphitrite TaxID=1232801 RepID=A0A6A4WTW3_AMPAM|nr:hypothetical protein FJT64_018702 [Amphibalanus amphitrite]